MPARHGRFCATLRRENACPSSAEAPGSISARCLKDSSLALDAPISLETSFSQMESHPLLPDILEIVRIYEDLRSNGKVPDASWPPRWYRRRLNQ